MLPEQKYPCGQEGIHRDVYVQCYKRSQLLYTVLNVYVQCYKRSQLLYNHVFTKRGARARGRGVRA